MAPPWRVNTPLSLHLVRPCAVLLAGLPAGWLAARLASREAGAGDAVSAAVVTGVVSGAFLWSALQGPRDVPLAVASLLLAWALVSLAAVDAVAYRLPDILTLPLLAAGLVATLFMPGSPILDHLAGAAVGWGALAALAWVYRRWRGIDGIGLGDAKLLGAAGAWLGWAALPSVLLASCAAAFLWVAWRIVRRGQPALNERIAFGVPLCLAIWTVWLEGPLVV